MLVGPAGMVAEKVASAFELGSIRVVRVGHAAAACERLAVAMPQVVVVLGALHPAERDALGDRATAVGALVLHVDPAIDDESLSDLIGRAGEAALARQQARDAVPPSSRPREIPNLGEDSDVDSGF